MTQPQFLSVEPDGHGEQTRGPCTTAGQGSGSSSQRARSKAAARLLGVPIVCPFRVLVDSREQMPYTFQGLKADAKQLNRPIIVERVWQKLDSGDYSLADIAEDGSTLMDHGDSGPAERNLYRRVCVERKSLADLYSTLGSGRERFEREHQRMAEMIAAGGACCVVIEATLDEAIKYPDVSGSRLHPKTVMRTGIAWQQRYRVPWYFVGGRRLSEVFTFRFLERAYLDAVPF